MTNVIPAEALLFDAVCVDGEGAMVAALPVLGIPAGPPLQAAKASPDSKKASAFLTSISLGIES
jgi:hypothetical protein